MSNAVLVCITVDMQSQLKWATIFWGWKHLMLRVSRFGSSQLRSFFTGSLLIFSDAIKQHCSIPCQDSGHEAIASLRFAFGCCFYMRKSVREGVCLGGGGSTWGELFAHVLISIWRFSRSLSGIWWYSPCCVAKDPFLCFFGSGMWVGQKTSFQFCPPLLLIFILCPWISLGTFHQRESNWRFSREFSLM